MQRLRAAAEGLESSYRRHGGEEAAYADDVRCLHGCVGVGGCLDCMYVAVVLLRSAADNFRILAICQL